MTALLIPFAKHCSNDLLVSPEEVPRGLACNCVCPACGYSVIAKQGTEKAWHFAHAKPSDCAHAYEKSVHELAKQLVREQKRLRLPALTVRVVGHNMVGLPITAEKLVFESHLVALDSCIAGHAKGDVTPDLTGERGGREILVEVTVFHRLMPEKKERLLKTGLAVMEIDLGLFRTVQATRALLEHELFENEANRRWIYHPWQDEVARTLEDELTARIAESDAGILEARRLKAEQDAREAERRAEQASRMGNPPGPASEPAAQTWTGRGWRRGPPETLDYLEWGASFPSLERWEPAREAFCTRLGLARPEVDAVMASHTKRSHLATTTPQALAVEWATKLDVEPLEIARHFWEAGYLTV
jgi:hypothetical protein